MITQYQEDFEDIGDIYVLKFDKRFVEVYCNGTAVYAGDVMRILGPYSVGSPLFYGKMDTEPRETIIELAIAHIAKLDIDDRINQPLNDVMDLNHLMLDTIRKKLKENGSPFSSMNDQKLINLALYEFNQAVCK